MKKKASISEKDIEVAKNPEQAMWKRAIENLDADIKSMENSMKVSKAFLEKAKEMAEKC